MFFMCVLCVFLQNKKDLLPNYMEINPILSIFYYSKSALS
ncbi:hypothetical protein CLCAR_1843 [Clostridium carboxidivorans P7]|nr:hypothetical protein CLCAR_1843 [Clostridium carboxidivorans P7]